MNATADERNARLEELFNNITLIVRVAFKAGFDAAVERMGTEAVPS